MNLLEAWNLIMNAAALAPLTKRDHIQVDQGGQVVREALSELAELKKPVEVPMPDAVPTAAPDEKG